VLHDLESFLSSLTLIEHRQRTTDHGQLDAPRPITGNRQKPSLLPFAALGYNASGQTGWFFYFIARHTKKFS
jgi:hypothetical protein